MGVKRLPADAPRNSNFLHPILEQLVQVRKVAEALGFPESVRNVVAGPRRHGQCAPGPEPSPGRTESRWR
jgi:hypothetical protein